MSIRVQQVSKVDTDSYTAYHGHKFLERRRLVVLLLKVQRQSVLLLLLLSRISVTLYITQQTHFDRVLSQVPRPHYCWIGDPDFDYSGLAFLVL